MDKLEQIKKVAKDLVKANDKAHKVLGFIGANTTLATSIQVDDEKFVPLMEELGIEPVVQNFSVPGYKYQVSYTIDGLIFFWIGDDEDLQKYNLYERRPIL